jgi:hypothetical protein
MKGSIFSIFSVVIGNCCRRFSKLDRCVMLAVLVLIALDSRAVYNEFV